MRRFALLALMLVPAIAVHAQINGYVVGGYVSAKLAESSQGTTVTLDSRAGFAVGLGMSRDVAKDISFAPELLYVQKGLDQVAGTDELKIKLGYIEVPVLFRAMFAGAKTKAFLTAGPEVAFKVSCSGEFSSGGNSVSRDCVDLGTSGIKSLDYGFMVGVGVTIQRFTLSARYDAGLANIDKGATNGDTLKNRAWLILASIAVK